MGSGKSTIGKKLAKEFNTDFYDLDSFIEKREGQSIQELFETKGEEAFRDIESKALQKLVKVICKKSVISLGGGTICFKDNLNLVKLNGILIYLKADPKTLFHRLANARTERPLLKDKTDEDLLNFIEETLNRRDPYYSQADLSVPVIDMTISELSEQIAKLV